MVDPDRWKASRISTKSSSLAWKYGSGRQYGSQTHQSHGIEQVLALLILIETGSTMAAPTTDLALVGAMTETSAILVGTAMKLDALKRLIPCLTTA
jgi:hypothetical protein